MADKATDLYMQWFTITGLTDATNAQTLNETAINTGLSIRGDFVWLVHQISLYFDKLDIQANRAAAWLMVGGVSTRAGLTEMPKAGDAGHIEDFIQDHNILTEGGSMFNIPVQSTAKYFPPFPLAAPKLSLYLQTGADVSTWRDKKVYARFGFTTAPLDAKMYAEIAETWGYQL